MTKMAFPNAKGTSGMHLRDYFATHALAGLLANPATRVESNDDLRAITEFSYDIANAMMKARDVNPEIS